MSATEAQTSRDEISQILKESSSDPDQDPDSLRRTNTRAWAAGFVTSGGAHIPLFVPHSTEEPDGEDADTSVEPDGAGGASEQRPRS